MALFMEREIVPAFDLSEELRRNHEQIVTKWTTLSQITGQPWPAARPSIRTAWTRDW